MAQVQQKRIGQIQKLSSDEITTLIKSKSEASKWAMAIDYVVADEVEEGETVENDKGSAYITMDRIGILTSTGLVPQNMLPSRIADVKNGSMSIPSSGTKWVFTEDVTGNKYVNESPSGSEELAVIDTIYRDKKTDGTREIYTQYRYVPDESTIGGGNEAGVFVPIPNDLVMVDGEGTVVNDDDDTNYTRQIDINIGSPGSHDSNILAIQNHQLVHTVSGVTAATYPSTQTTAPGFGSTFNATSMTVDSTGHVTAASNVPITVPSAAATASAYGLVKVGGTVQPIASDCALGTASSDGYTLVAAADHTHSASTFKLTNTNDGTKEYDGTDNVDYNFDKFLQVKLPQSVPVSDGLFLVTKSENGTRYATWADPQDIVHPRYAFIPVSGGSTATSELTLGTPTEKSTDMSVASNALSGLLTGKTFVVSYSIGISTSANTYLDELKVSVMEGSTEKASVIHVVDESLSPLNNYVNGTMFYVPSSTSCKFKITNTRTGVTWTASAGTIQVAEVK